MGYNLKSITLENFVVFKSRTSITFDNTSLNFIEGAQTSDPNQSNGAGKSLVICGISLALFGKGIRSQYLSDYISDTNPAGGVYIGLELIDSSTGNILKIERWRRPNSDTNKAKVWLNGSSISDDMTLSKIDELIQAHTGVTYSNFTACVFSVMLPGFMKLKPAQRFEMLESALAVKKMETVLKKINTKIHQATEKYTATSRLLLQKTADFGKESARHELFSANTSSLEASIKEQDSRIARCMDEEQIHTARLQELDSLLAKATEKHSTISAQHLASVAAEQVEVAAISKLASSIAVIDKGIKKRTSANKLECSLCHSELTEMSKESIRSHYESEKKTHEDTLEGIKATTATLQARKAQYDSKIDKIRTLKSACERALQSTYANLLSAEQLKKQSQQSLLEASAALNTSLLEELRLSVDTLTSQVSSLEKQIAIYSAWKLALSKNGLRLSYIREEVDTLSALTSKYASIIYDQKITIKFFINDERDNPSLDFTVNGKNAGLFSTGESRRLEIAITLSLMALLKTAGMSLDFLLLDEAFDGLSTASKQRMETVLDELAKLHQIVIISHEESMKHHSGHVISITKDPVSRCSTVAEYTR